MPASAAVEEVREYHQKDWKSTEFIKPYSSAVKIYKSQQLESEPIILKKDHRSESISSTSIPLSIKEVIERSERILKFEKNWDECGALPVDRIAYSNAISFIVRYSERILDVSGKELIAPQIVPVKDGSVDLEWNLDHSYLLINFRVDDKFNALYYLAFKNADEITFDANGQIKLDNVNDKFAAYLIDLS